MYALRAGPVSYTHLDVYKRQLMNTADGFEEVPEFMLETAAGQGMKAVSYTHLLIRIRGIRDNNSPAL